MERRNTAARLAGWLVIGALSAALLSCSGATSTPQLTRDPVAGLPALPLDAPGHTLSATQGNHIDGSAAISMSQNASVQGSSLVLFAGAPPALEWGIYRYTPNAAQSEVVKSATLGFSVTSGESGWVAIANYQKGIWEIRGPYNAQGGQSLDFTGLDLGGYLSPGGNLYFLAASYNGTFASVGGIDLTSDVIPPATFSISGKVTDTSTGNGIQGVTVRLASGPTTTTDASGNYQFTSLNAGPYTVTADTFTGYNPFDPAMGYPVVLGPDATGKDFSAAPTAPPPVTYSTGAHIMKDKIDHFCVGCHNPSGQKPDMPLRTYAECQAAGFDLIWAQVTAFANNSPMPKNPSPERTEINGQGAYPNNDRDYFNKWKANGYAQ